MHLLYTTARPGRTGHKVATREIGGTYRAALCSNLNSDLDHVNGLNDAGGSHTTETTIQERLCCFPGRTEVFPLEVRHLQTQTTCVQDRGAGSRAGNPYYRNPDGPLIEAEFTFNESRCSHGDTTEGSRLYW